jgi:hypothetical protein
VIYHSTSYSAIQTRTLIAAGDHLDFQSVGTAMKRDDAKSACRPIIISVNLMAGKEKPGSVERPSAKYQKENAICV